MKDLKIFTENIEDSAKEQTILCNYIKKLRKELNQKNKIIDEILNSDFFESDCPFSCDEKNELECCESNCKDDYKSCWLKYFEKRISNGN